ncbi:lysis system i-spanin subunit Rz [Burkholderia multivorans]|uniref:lysis system i-spanin subunit Rz n=1 Tax=Burkholderia multivorans TaxID=87883 RepID=UPI001C24B776|nr:lysis protein [Burkholderia multivorans]MBU9437094.1 lysis protein [Burkholderia multivorans]MBU9606299.1 lysis protein [Burkholderia multivorans]MBU9624858.1 lysis protein [Burkholderia multivorans]MDN7511004.1 lysis system i-spanin subunit Rz [Burkholderia multivorans]
MIAALVAMALLFGAGWMARGWIAARDISRVEQKHALDLKALSDKAAEVSEASRKLEAGMRDTVAKIDQLQSDLDHANSENADLRSRLSSGTQRVYVRAKCPAAVGGGLPGSAAPASMDDEARRAELDPAFAGELAGIAGDGDDAIRRLTALQKYVREVCMAPAAP